MGIVSIFSRKQSHSKTPVLFSQADLIRLVVPLIIETFLSMSMGFIGTIMVASAGEEAVSGVSLVDNINAFILVFVASLATGGAIIIAQYLGKGSFDDAQRAARQLLYTTLLTSFALMAIALIGNRYLLSAVFGEIEPAVMECARIYFLITAISYPFTAITTSISAVFRSSGNSRTPMMVTLMMSIINVICCAIMIYGFDMGVAGAAAAVLISRVVASAVMLVLIKNSQNVIFLDRIFMLKIDVKTIRNILKVGIPSGLDSGMFQLGRLVMQSLIATFGTVSIAANAVVGQIINIAFIPSNAIQLAIITVVGQCVGAGEHEQAAAYTKRFLKYNYMTMAVLCAAAYLLKGELFAMFNLSEQSVELGFTVLMYTCIFAALLNPPAFTLSNALRAAGDVRYAMIVSIASMWLARICLSYVLEFTLALGLMSVWFAMYADWFVRAVLYGWRFISGKWRTKRIV